MNFREKLWKYFLFNNALQPLTHTKLLLNFLFLFQIKRGKSMQRMHKWCLFIKINFGGLLLILYIQSKIKNRMPFMRYASFEFKCLLSRILMKNLKYGSFALWKSLTISFKKQYAFFAPYFYEQDKGNRKKGLTCIHFANLHRVLRKQNWKILIVNQFSNL